MSAITDPWHSRPIDVHRWSDHPEVVGLVDRIWDTYLPSDKTRGPKPRTAFRNQLRVLILDLYVAWLEDPDKEQVFRDVVEGGDHHDDTGGQVVLHRSAQPAEYENYNRHHDDLVHPRGLRSTTPRLREQDLHQFDKHKKPPCLRSSQMHGVPRFCGGG